MNNRTEEAVWNQIRAMNCPKYNILLLNQETKEPRNFWGVTPAGVMKLVPFMSFMNGVKGWNVYVEPAPKANAALVLVDDLSPEKVEEMRQDGLEPACVVETSPGNMQVWVRFGTGEMPPEERRILARGLARGYGGDPHSAGSSHKGRLAGYANLKPKHLGKVREGRSPWVLCRESRGGTCRLGSRLRACAHWEAERQARHSRRQPAQKPTPPQAFPDRHVPRPRPGAPDSSPGIPTLQMTVARARQYFDEWERWHRARGLTVNYSVRDYGVCCRLFKEKHPRWQIREALLPLIDRECAAKLRRKAPDYLERTLDVAWRRVFG